MHFKSHSVNMKRLSTVFALVFLIVSAQAQCIIDSAAQPLPGISPAPSALPCVERSIPYFQTIQVNCPKTFDTVVNLVVTQYTLTETIDSMELDSVTNLPTGMTFSRNPSRLKGGENGCLTFSGTTTDPAGKYNLGWYGTAWVHSQAGRRTVTGNLNRYSFVDYYLHVIDQGTSCYPAGISDLNPALNAIISVSPNPSNGNFSLHLNAGGRVSGLAEIIDVTGRTVYTREIDLIGSQSLPVDLSTCAKGLYTLVVKTANGIATKRISID